MQTAVLKQNLRIQSYAPDPLIAVQRKLNELNAINTIIVWNNNSSQFCVDYSIHV